MAITITALSGGTTPADGSDPRTFPTIWNATATALEGVADDLDTLETLVGANDLDSLVGVAITTPVTGDVLTYNGTSWLNGSPVGSILQVVSTTKTDTFSSTSTSFADITGLSASITPSSTSSKIMAIVTLSSGSNSTRLVNFRLMRDAVPISVGDAAGSRSQSSIYYFMDLAASDTLQMETAAINFLDSPSTTSTVTYKMQIKMNAGTAYVNRTAADTDNAVYPRLASTITLMEVAG